MPQLPDKPTLASFQHMFQSLKPSADLNRKQLSTNAFCWAKNVGELFKAVRKTEGLLVDENSNFSETGDELADIFIYICAIANKKTLLSTPQTYFPDIKDFYHLMVSHKFLSLPDNRDTL